MKPRFRFYAPMQAWIQTGEQDGYRLVLPSASYKRLDSYTMFLRGLFEWRA